MGMKKEEKEAPEWTLQLTTAGIDH